MPSPLELARQHYRDQAEARPRINRQDPPDGMDIFDAGLEGAAKELAQIKKLRSQKPPRWNDIRRSVAELENWANQMAEGAAQEK